MCPKRFGLKTGLAEHFVMSNGRLFAVLVCFYEESSLGTARTLIFKQFLYASHYYIQVA